VIAQLNNGDPLAFDELYTRCSAYIAFICQKFCYNKEDAEEVVQDTFLIAYKKANTLRAETLVAYLQKIAIHGCYRKRRGTQLIPMPDATDYIANREETDADFLPEEYLHNQENRTELLHIIKALPRIQWETVYLNYYASCSVEEIARLQGCSLSNVYKNLRTARQSIKDHLEGKRKKKVFKGALPVSVGMASLAAFFVIEEQIFTTMYVSGAAPCWVVTGTATAAAGTVAASAAAPVVGYIATACALVAVAVSAVVYYYIAFESVPEQVVASQATVQATTDPPTPASTPMPYISEVQAPEPAPETEPPTEPETDPPTTAAPTTATPATVPPPPTEPPTPAPTLPPPLPDRTAQILAALSQAHTGDAVAHILQYYGFTFDQYIRGDGERFRFYVTHEGSGNIFVGNATCDNGIWQRMHHALFNNSAVPSDIIDLITFMERN